MTRLAHLSDLHFGRHDPRAVDALLEDLIEVRPDLVAVSGDLTQRARRREFAAAMAFLRALPCPWIAVPGNHDIPLHDVGRRLLFPLARYHEMVDSEPLPRRSVAGLAVLGLNTAWHLVWKGGRVTPLQLVALRGWAKQEAGKAKAVVAHHPFAGPGGGQRGHPMVRGWREALAAMEDSGVDLVLTGHHHLAGHSESRAFSVGGPHRVVIVQAGTAVSHRMRGEPNSYNLVDVDAHRILVERRDWRGKSFEAAAGQEYPRIAQVHD